jgi:CheY-like chemotaxis protein
MKPLVVVVRDLVFRSKIHAAAERQGVPLRLAPRGSTLAEAIAGIERPVVLADLSEPGLLEQIRALKATGPVRVIGYLGHLQEEFMAEARAAGVDEVLTRGQFVVRLDSLLQGGELH